MPRSGSEDLFGLVSGFPQQQPIAESFTRTLCRFVPNEEKEKQDTGQFPFLWETSGSPEQLGSCFTCTTLVVLVFLAKEQVVREQTVRSRQGFSEHRGILGKVPSSAGQVYRRKPEGQEDPRMVGYVK